MSDGGEAVIGCYRTRSAHGVSLPARRKKRADEVRQLHLKWLHNFYPTNLSISYFSDFDNRCTFVEMRLKCLTRLCNIAGSLMINAP